MKKFAIVSAVVLTAVGTMVQCTTSQQTTPPAAAAQNAASKGPKNRKTLIHMTKNHLLGLAGQRYETVCIANVATEILTAAKNDKVSWKIKPATGEDDLDNCDNLAPERVQLRFTSDEAFGTDTLQSNAGGNISGDVVASAKKVHKYQVYYINGAGEYKPAGPDPEIYVNCDGCGPGGEGGSGGAPQ